MPCEVGNMAAMYRTRVWQLLGAVWAGWCLWWLADGMCAYSPRCIEWFQLEHPAERRMTGLLVVMLSGFPMGFYLPALVSDIVRWLGFASSNAGAWGHAVEWSIAAATGFVQWFVLLPRGIKLLYGFVSRLRSPRP